MLTPVPRPPSPFQIEGWAAWTLIIALVVCVLFLASGLLAQGGQHHGNTVTTVHATPNVVLAVRDLAELQSAEAHVERVVDLRDRESHMFGLVQAQDSILLVAVGDVTAGVDLGALRDGDVTVDAEHHTARIVLPPTHVLSTHLDNDHTWVYSRDTDVLAQRHEDLETRARQEAERTLEESAVASGLVDRAERNAQRTVESLVRSLGFTQVTVTSR